MAPYIKQEPIQLLPEENNNRGVIILSSSSDDSFGFDDSDESDIESNNPTKKQRVEYVLPVGFLDPLRPEDRLALQKSIVTPPPKPTSCAEANDTVPGVPLMSNLVKEGIIVNGSENVVAAMDTEETVGNVSQVKAMKQSCKQFWKAGDYKALNDIESFSKTEGMDHLRVHPRFLHSNATSHKWALGAFAELLDNALDEVCYGATFVNVDVLKNLKDNSKMLLIEDNGGGMTPVKIRQCMSLGYSVKNQMVNTIGQYGNGFKTSTMRLGADVIVFSRCQGKVEGSATQSVGMLSYTFLRSTGKEDIVVPMIHYEKNGNRWNKLSKPSADCCQRNLECIVQWSPYESEEDLIQQFNGMKDHGTRIIIYNLWEDDQGSPELDFDTDQHDIQIRGVSRDQEKIDMAAKYPNSKHFLTYRHSLRSYASILYRTIPLGFQISLRGKDVDHHDIVEDMMHTNEITYKPVIIANASSKNHLNMVATVKIGFVKDATHHIDVQGFNVYHKNRLIKPFWRVWNAAGSDGRGVIGALEANFVEPAHDKQGFERTIVLSRLESKLADVQKKYWRTNCHLVGYAPRGGSAKKSITPEKVLASTPVKDRPDSAFKTNGNTTTTYGPRPSAIKMTGKAANMPPPYVNADEIARRSQFQAQASTSGEQPRSECGLHQVAAAQVHVKREIINGGELSPSPVATGMDIKLYEENNLLRNSLKNALQDLQNERDKNMELQKQVLDIKQQMDKLDKEQEVFVSSFSEERSRRDTEEENLRKRNKDASQTIEALVRKLKLLEARSVRNCHCRS